MRIVFLGLLLLTSSCQSAHLRVRTEYLDEGYLASSQIESLELSSCSFFGEQLVIKYKGLSAPGQLKLSVRFSNHEIKTYVREITASRGYWVHRLLGEEYCCEGPILGYKVELYENSCCLATFCHLWAEKI
jgi:hypothetical protein